MPNQLRTMSSKAIVEPGSMLTVVCFTASDVALPALKVSCTFFELEMTLAMRMSLCHCELKPGRWPTDGMTSAVAEGQARMLGVTGEVRLIETGMDVFGATSSACLPPVTPFEP